MYSDKGAVITTGVVQHTAAPATHPASKQVLLDTRDDKLRISYQQSVDKEAANMQPAATYEKKGDERLDRVESVKPALVQQMSKPLPAVPAPAAPLVTSSTAFGRVTSESEPQYVTVYEDGAQLFSPRTINLLGSAARLPPPPAPPAEPTTPTETMLFPLAPTPFTPADTLQTTETTVTVGPTPAAQSSVAQRAQPPAVVAVPSWPPAASEHNLAVAKRVVEASTVREESPLMAGVEKETPSPLIVSAGPQPYELAHPKNAIDVVQLPLAAPKMPAPAVETVASNIAPLPLLPPTQKMAPAPKAAVAPQPLPAPVVSTAAIPALPAPTTVSKNVVVPAPRAVVAKTSYEQAQPRIVRPAVAPAPRRQWKMPRMWDVLLSPYAIGCYLLLAGLTLMQLPFWVLVSLAVLVDVVVIAYRKPATTLAVMSAPQPLPLPGPVVSTAVTPALPAPAPHPLHVRTPSREFGTQTELVEASQEESVESINRPRSPAQFFAALRQQHGSTPTSPEKPVVERTAQHTVQIRKLAPSARQQAAVPLLSDEQPIVPAGVILSNRPTHSGSQVIEPQRYVQTAQTVSAGAALPSPSKLPNPLLDALNSASPRREVKELTEAVETYNDMQPASTLPPQVQAAARKANIPTAGSAAVQGAANPVVMVPTWPSTEQQHAVAQARHIVEASTVRDHSALLDEDSNSSTSHQVPFQSQPYEMTAVPHSRTAVTETSDMMALPAPDAPVSTTGPLALPVPVAPSFRVSAAEVTPATSIQRVVQTTTPLPLTTQLLTAEEHKVNAVKHVSEETKEEVVVADVGEVDRVSDVGAGIVNDGNTMRLRHIASHVHSQ